MRRVIVDFKKLTPEILALLVDKYPYGYDDDHIISFKNAKNELIECVEVRTADTIYLVKVSKKLENTMENYDVDDYDDDDLNEPISEMPGKLPDDDALVLSLYYISGNSVPEICEITGWTQSSTKVKLYRARQKVYASLFSILKFEMKSLI